MVYGITFILALCSMVYELLLGQALAAFLGNTVLRYSVTISLYLFAKGVGAWLAEGRAARQPVMALLAIEWWLSALGGASVVILHLLDAAGRPSAALSLGGHALIVLIGVLTGFELPLLMVVKAGERANREHRMLAADYAGALAGVLGFAFCFYPRVGLLPTAFLIAALNVIAALALAARRRGITARVRTPYYGLVCAHALLLAVLAVCVWRAAPLQEHFIARYLKT